MKRDNRANRAAGSIKKRAFIVAAVALAVISAFSLVSDTDVQAATYTCPGCRAKVSRKLTKKSYKQQAVTRKITKKKLKTQNIYKLLNKVYNDNGKESEMFASTGKSSTVTWSVTGSGTVGCDWGSLGLTSNYTKSNTKSSGGGMSRMVPAHTNVAFYVGHKADVFSVNVTQTTRTLCPWCGRTLKSSTKSWCNKAVVPVKDSTVYWKTVTSKTNSFAGTITVDR